MAVFGVSITKRAVWRGNPQEFSNVYHYHTSEGQLFPDRAVIDALVALERPVFSNEVSFVVARTWGPTETGPVASVTREIVDLTGTGSAGATSSVYRESCILLAFPLGRYGVRNRPQFLRKWLHTFGALHGYISDGNTRNAAPAPAGTALANYRDGIRVLNPEGLVGGLDLATAGDRVNQGPGVYYPFLEHRQLGS